MEVNRDIRANQLDVIVYGTFHLSVGPMENLRKILVHKIELRGQLTTREQEKNFGNKTFQSESNDSYRCRYDIYLLFLLIGKLFCFS